MAEGASAVRVEVEVVLFESEELLAARTAHDLDAALHVLEVAHRIVPAKASEVLDQNVVRV